MSETYGTQEHFPSSEYSYACYAVKWSPGSRPDTSSYTTKKV